ncbi:glycosyl hydrolase [Ancylomarina sp. 16SWW S1-10-2]|uniref:glycosyl hydrolase n=1 Tax=Ancylomarina sp. 16SWW S1-10-2 TaxID=2499681 RepID=UPI001E459927|nr:glycosyl hydrolase [Ancylomarina sp. 16SWW S1-10-2]
MKKITIIIALFLMVFSKGTNAQSSQVLDYLYSISGKKTISGQHNREPNAKPALWTNAIKKMTGKYPALWSGDFLFQQDNIDNRWTMIREAKKQWDNGSIVSIMWHACPPDEGEPCAWKDGILNSQLSDAQWKDLLTEGSDLNEKWKTRMDDIAVYFKFLEDNGVEVLFKPFHEMNQGLFWWGGRPGPDGTAKLYRYTHDYMENTKGLSNLVWVWDMQDMTRDFEAYNPGDDYWDVFAFDVYDNGYDASWYEYILPIVGNKPMAFGECTKLPNEELLAAQPRWTYFMSWAELVERDNTIEEIQKVYDNPRVITRDELPKWK